MSTPPRAGGGVALLAATARQIVMPTYRRQQVELVHGQGARVWDAEGREHLDLVAGLGVLALGHSHPAVVAAVREQAGLLTHVSNLYWTAPAVRLAQRLSAGSLGGQVFLANSGTEANECALKLARRRRPGGGLVALRGGFHGRTAGSLSVTAASAYREPFGPLLPGVTFVAHDDANALRAAVTGDTAAVVLEVVQGEAGVRPLAADVLRAARAACDATGALLIVDEIQSGVGRSGTLWAWQQLGVRPDVMTCAKGLANGLPIGACVAAPWLDDTLRPGEHGSTFAGGPLVCVAAERVLDVVERPRFLAEVRAKGELLRERLRGAGFEQVRGLGLMVGFETSDAPRLAARALAEERLLVNATGPTTIRLLPSLTIAPEQLRDACARLERLR